MYRFLLSPAWLGWLAAALAVAVAMSLLGAWQLSRYQERAETNARIDAADPDRPAALTTVLAAPGPGQSLGPAPADDASWTMVSVTGRYDPTHEILVRGRTVSGRVGYEVVTPLVRRDGSAVLVDRGWVPPAATGMVDRPAVPAVPAGEATVVGWVRPSERGGPAAQRRDGALQARRIDVPALVGDLPYPLHHGYLLLDTQHPAADRGLTPVPVRRENAWLNAGYAGQWWIFAGLVLAGFGWLARREAHRGSLRSAGAGGAPALPSPT